MYSGRVGEAVCAADVIVGALSGELCSGCQLALGTSGLGGISLSV